MTGKQLFCKQSHVGSNPIISTARSGGSNPPPVCGFGVAGMHAGNNSARAGRDCLRVADKADYGFLEFSPASPRILPGLVTG